MHFDKRVVAVDAEAIHAAALERQQHPVVRLMPLVVIEIEGPEQLPIGPVLHADQAA